MLDRPASARHAARHRERTRRWRRRQRDGTMAVLVEIDGSAVAALIAWHWLLQHEADDRNSIGCIIADARGRGEAGVSLSTPIIGIQ
jgi:hypothetical protein